MMERKREKRQTSRRPILNPTWWRHRCCCQISILVLCSLRRDVGWNSPMNARSRRRCFSHNIKKYRNKKVWGKIIVALFWQRHSPPTGKYELIHFEITQTHQKKKKKDSKNVFHQIWRLPVRRLSFDVGQKKRERFSLNLTLIFVHFFRMFCTTFWRKNNGDCASHAWYFFFFPFELRSFPADYFVLFFPKIFQLNKENLQFSSPLASKVSFPVLCFIFSCFWLQISFGFPRTNYQIKDERNQLVIAQQKTDCCP